MNRNTFLLSVFIFALAILAQTSGAQTLLRPGDPDPTFGMNGRVLTQLEGGCIPGDLILLPDNKILSLCNQTIHKNSIANNYFLLIRHNSDGSPDSGFGINGVITLPVGSGNGVYYEGEKLYLQSDGKIIIAGTFDKDFGMLRVNSDGSVDYSFGVGGQVKTDFSGFEENSMDYLSGLTVRPDGKLMLYGKSTVQNLTFSCTPSNPFCYPPEFERLALAQYDANGSPDLSFGERGIQRSRFTEDRHYALSLVNEPDGKFTFIAGVYERVLQTNGWESLFTQLAVRYNTDGSIDKNFGKNGYTELPSNALFHSLPDGKFLTLESCYQTCGGYNTRFMRFNSDFMRDTTFGSNGFAPYSLYYRENGAIYPQPDGKFIFSSYWVVGGIGSAQAYSYIYRFNSDGSMDLSFGNSNGVIGFDLDGDNVLGSYAPSKYIFQPDGKVIAVNYFEPPQNTSGIRGIAMMRFIGGNDANSDFKSIFRER